MNQGDKNAVIFFAVLIIAYAALGWLVTHYGN